MSSRDNKLWLQFWRDKRTDFHQKTVNHLLARFWPGLNLVHGSRVFVPLCGKSLDMIWLAKQGHEVIGVELSPVAVRAFFRENRLQPSKRTMGCFTVWVCGKISILCGDFFSLTKSDLGVVEMVYDRAALTALPEDIRKLYAAHLKLILPDTIDVLLLTAEDVEATDVQNPDLSVDEEINSLFSDDFNIDLTHVESLVENCSALPGQLLESTTYKVYRLSSRVDI